MGAGSVSRALERFAREAAGEVERITEERRRFRAATRELVDLGDRLTGAHLAATVGVDAGIRAAEDALRRKYFPKSAQLWVSDWDGSAITVSPTGRTRTVYVPARNVLCVDEHRDWEHQALPWLCSLEPLHDGDHVAKVDGVEVARWSARAAVAA
jgi:hypothetical protein